MKPLYTKDDWIKAALPILYELTRGLHWLDMELDDYGGFFRCTFCFATARKRGDLEHRPTCIVRDAGELLSAPVVEDLLPKSQWKPKGTSGLSLQVPPPPDDAVA